MTTSPPATAPRRDRSDPAFHWIAGGAAAAVRDLPRVPVAEFHAAVVRACRDGGRIAALCILPPAVASGGDGGRGAGHDAGGGLLLAVLADDLAGRIGLLTAAPDGERAYPSLTPDLPQAQAFEREIFEDHGIRPAGHPWLKPLRRHRFPEAAAGGVRDAETPAYEFFRVEGPGIHEVAVGPVHAGVIEPGHFRFQCRGETVLHLEIRLGYQHRGAEALLLRSAPERRLVIAESIAGDTAVGHALAHCLALEALGGTPAPPAAGPLRSLALEIERLANHAGDLGALCNDVGYLPGASWFGRLRGDFLNLLLELSGNRFGRGLLRPGGVRRGPDAPMRRSIAARLKAAGRDLERVAELTFASPSVGSRFERCGVVSRADAEVLGLVGPAARASGCDLDVRRDHPFPACAVEPAATVVVSGGDVMARAEVRRREAGQSIALALRLLDGLPEGPLAMPGWPPAPASGSAPGMLAVALVEGWRGEILHLLATDARGEPAVCKIVDPSFHNWPALAWAMRGGAISDFPLCNKSFNLSYAGHDL
jgi:Ni,Fe-hydrogenase III large subunit